MAGQTSLVKRVAAGKLQTGTSEKGKGMVVMTTDMNHSMPVVHTANDTEIE